jgi:hypothetical protein
VKLKKPKTAFSHSFLECRPEIMKMMMIIMMMGHEYERVWEEVQWEGNKEKKRY